MNIDDNSMKVIKWGAILVGGIVAVVATKKIVTSIIDKVQANKSTKELSQSVKEITNKVAPTITASQAGIIANNLFNAMESTGTDENAIEQMTNQLKNAGDWALVIDKFGYKEYGTYGSPLYSWLPSTPTNLLGWLRNECSSSLISKLEAKWAQYGIVG